MVKQYYPHLSIYYIPMQIEQAKDSLKKIYGSHKKTTQMSWVHCYLNQFMLFYLST